MNPSGIHLEKTSAPILFFDGYCGLCHWLVNFIIENEKNPAIRFCPLESPAAELLLLPYGISPKGYKTVVFLESGQTYSQSEAVFKVLNYIGFPWSSLKALKIFPKSFLDKIYDRIALNRFKYFERTNSCPTFKDLQPRRWLG